LHERRKMLSSALSPELKKKYKRNAISVRKGDTVKVMRGSHKDHQGEIMRVDMKKYKIYVNGIIAKKTDGKEVEKPIDPSNVMVTEIPDDDKERREALMRTVEAE